MLTPQMEKSDSYSVPISAILTPTCNYPADNAQDVALTKHATGRSVASTKLNSTRKIVSLLLHIPPKISRKIKVLDLATWFYFLNGSANPLSPKRFAFSNVANMAILTLDLITIYYCLALTFQTNC